MGLDSPMGASCLETGLEDEKETWSPPGSFPRSGRGSSPVEDPCTPRSVRGVGDSFRLTAVSWKGKNPVGRTIAGFPAPESPVLYHNRFQKQRQPLIARISF